MSDVTEKRKTRHYLNATEFKKFGEDARTPDMTVSMLAELYDLHETTVRNHLHKMGLVTLKGMIMKPTKKHALPTGRVTNLDVMTKAGTSDLVPASVTEYREPEQSLKMETVDSVAPALGLPRLETAALSSDHLIEFGRRLQAVEDLAAKLGLRVRVERV